jgi:hypothetical protein
MPEPSSMFDKLAKTRQKAERAKPVEQEPDSPHQKKGRARGKRSDPNYEQVGAYIPKELNKQVKRLLIDEEGLDFSDLVTQLLEEWVNQHSN